MMNSMKQKRARWFFAGLVSALPLLGGVVLLSPNRAYADDDDPTSEVDAPDATVDGGYADTDPSAVTVFQNDLSPYGTWVVDDAYGTVWVPNGAVVGADFAPYQSAGHWALTDDGEWLWVSDYSWGYIPFHYGRWVWISDRGWSWIPGRAYAPSWVVWRTGEYGYIGWAPMPPAYYWDDGAYVAIAVPPPAPFVFCDTDSVFEPEVQKQVIRDRASVRKAADGTHPYHLVTGAHYGPSYPTLTQAHYSKPAPKPSTADPKAIAVSRPQWHTMSGSSTAVPSRAGGAAPNVKVINTNRSPGGSGNVKEIERTTRPGTSSMPTSRGSSSRGLTPAEREVTPEPRPAVRRAPEPTRQAMPERAPERVVSRPQPEPAPAPVHVSNPRPASHPSQAPVQAPVQAHPAAPAPASHPAPAPTPAPTHRSSGATHSSSGGHRR